MDLIDALVAKNAPISGKRPRGELQPTYDLVFRDNLFIGCYEAYGPKIRFYKSRKIRPVIYKVQNLDFRKQSNLDNLDPIPGGVQTPQNVTPDILTRPLFIDLRALPEVRDTIFTYMLPVLNQQATVVASQLHAGRLIYINCQLGQNRSAMFAMAVVVAYQRAYEDQPDYTASQALKLLQRARPMLNPHDWVMEGFRMMGYEPQLPKEKRRRKRTPSARYSPGGFV